MSGQALLRDLVEIPDEVHAGDFVLALAKGVGQKSTITDYVVTDPLAGNFDKALGLIKSAVETGASRAAYLDGSFGSGKSHFMAVLLRHPHRRPGRARQEGPRRRRRQARPVARGPQVPARALPPAGLPVP